MEPRDKTDEAVESDSSIGRTPPLVTYVSEDEWENQKDEFDEEYNRMAQRYEQEQIQDIPDQDSDETTIDSDDYDEYSPY